MKKSVNRVKLLPVFEAVQSLDTAHMRVIDAISNATAEQRVMTAIDVLEILDPALEALKAASNKFLIEDARG